MAWNKRESAVKDLPWPSAGFRREPVEAGLQPRAFGFGLPPVTRHFFSVTRPLGEQPR
jgi:hypothetical protein